MGQSDSLKGLYTYAMVKAMFDRGSDYIDSFWPFVVRVLPRDGTAIGTDQARTQIESEFGLSIPTHSLRTIIDRAKHRGLVAKEPHDQVRLSEKGKEYVDHLETKRDVERRIVELVRDAQAFLVAHHGLSLTEAKIKRTIETVITENLALFALLTDRPLPAIQGGGEPVEAAVIDYFRAVEQGQPSMFRTLRDMVCGSIISSVVYGHSFDDAARKFSDTEVFLDSNLALSMLGLDHDHYVKPALELLTLMRSQRRFQLRIFDFTVAEIVSLLRSYKGEHGKYLPGVPVNSIHSALKLRGFSPGAVSEIIANLDKRLSNLGVHIVSTAIQLRDYQPEAGKEEKLSAYKPDQPPLGKRHDLAAIEMTGQLRGSSARRVEEARCFFLTSDLRLAKYAYYELGHEAQATISEVLPDRLLTNLLWLKNPSSLNTVSIDAVIALHSRDLFIDRDVWDRFSTTVNKMVAEGSVQEADASLLLYDGHVQESLRTHAAGSDALDSRWLIKRVVELRTEREEREAAMQREQANAFEKQRVDALSSQQHSFEELLETELAKKDLDALAVTSSLQRTTEMSLTSLWKRCARDARWLTLGLRAVLGASFAALLLTFWPWLARMSNFLEIHSTLIGWLLTVGVVVMGFSFKLGSWPRRLESRLTASLFDYRTRELEGIIQATHAALPAVGNHSEKD